MPASSQGLQNAAELRVSRPRGQTRSYAAPCVATVLTHPEHCSTAAGIEHLNTNETMQNIESRLKLPGCLLAMLPLFA